MEETKEPYARYQQRPGGGYDVIYRADLTPEEFDAFKAGFIMGCNAPRLRPFIDPMSRVEGESR